MLVAGTTRAWVCTSCATGRRPSGRISTSSPGREAARWSLVRFAECLRRQGRTRTEVMMQTTQGAKTPARILVVDDHPVIRLGIRQMITADPTLTVCGEAESGEAALEVVAHREVDLAIVDLSPKELS